MITFKKSFMKYKDEDGLMKDVGAMISSSETVSTSLSDLGVTATATELNYCDGVTSNIQTQLDGKQATITGGATTITSSNLTASRALISNSSGKVAVSAVTSTELGYLDGVTSNIQTQINDKFGATVSRTANTVLAAPNGSAGGATFRKLVAADLPAFTRVTAYAGDTAVANGGKIMSVTIPSSGAWLVVANIYGGVAWGDGVTSTSNSGFFKINDGSGGGKVYTSFTAGYTFSFYNYSGASATYAGSSMTAIKIG